MKKLSIFFGTVLKKESETKNSNSNGALFLIKIFSVVFFLALFGFGVPINLAKASQTNYTDAECGYFASQGYTVAHCSGYVLMNKSNYTAGEQMDVRLRQTASGYLGIIGPPVKVTFNGLEGEYNTACNSGGCDVAWTTTTDSNFLAPSIDGCYNMTVYFKWSPDYGGYDGSLTIPYTVGAGCGGGGGGGGGNGANPPIVSMSADLNPVSLNQTTNISWDTNLTADNCTIKEGNTILSDGTASGSVAIQYENSSQAGIHTYNAACVKYLSALPKKNNLAKSDGLFGRLGQFISSLTNGAQASQVTELWSYGTININFNDIYPPTVIITPQNNNIKTGMTLQFSVEHPDSDTCQVVSSFPGFSTLNCQSQNPFIFVAGPFQSAGNFTFTATDSNPVGSGTDHATVAVTVPNAPDLTADPSTPSSVIFGVKTDLIATIRNVGTLPTGNGFHNFFQVTDTDPTPPLLGYNSPKNIFDKIFNKAYALTGIQDLSPAIPVTSALAAGETISITYPKYTFTTAGMWWVRACADKYNRNTSHVSTPPDEVNELTNEGNNCGDWTTVTVTPSGPKPDLVAGQVTPTTVAANDSVTLAAQITNIGNNTTGNSFHNFIQVLNYNPGNGNGNTGFLEKYKKMLATIFFPGEAIASGGTGGGSLPSCYATFPGTSMITLAAGASGTLSYLCTFTSPGTYYARACADKTSPSTVLPAEVTESNEGNNCASPWTPITVTAPTKLPDLIASVPSAKKLPIAINSPTSFVSTITNLGPVGTGAAGTIFKNFAQFSTGVNGTGRLVDLPAVSMLALAAGGSDTMSTTYTFSVPGTYYGRVCADKTNRNTIPPAMVPESNETNNCSNWASFNVIGGMTGILTPDALSCIIPLNGSDCLMHFVWSVINPQGATTEVVQEMVGVVGTGNPGQGKLTIPHDTSTFRLLNNNVTLDLKTITSSCENKTFWDERICTDKKVNAECAQGHYGCVKGNSAKGTGDSTNGWTWECLGSPTGSNASCTQPGTQPGLGGHCPAGLTPYPTCDQCINGAVNPPQCNVDGGGNCIDPKATNNGEPAPCIYKKVIKWFER